MEVQPSGITNILDIIAFLETLGYNNETIKKNGFDDQISLARYIINFCDYYAEDMEQEKEKFLETALLPIPKISTRIVEGMAFLSPWLITIIPLYVLGISLWMTWRLAADATTALLIGVLLGIIVSELQYQLFQRLFSFYYSQGNNGEVRRILKRYYITTIFVLAILTLIVYSIAQFQFIPNDLFTLTMISTITISLFKTTYLVLFALKKVKIIIFSFILSILSLLSVYYVTPYDMEPTIHYLIAFGVGYLVLITTAAYYNYKIFNNKPIDNNKNSYFSSAISKFYSPVSSLSNTMKSRLTVQVLENYVYGLIGVLNFVILFGDRALSYIFNPLYLVSSYGMVLPMTFNPTYHTGADLALIAIIPTAILQYVLTSHLYVLVYNKTIRLRISELKVLNHFFITRYKIVLFYSLLSSMGMFFILYAIGPQIIFFLRGTEVSIEIFRYALIANTFISVFLTNSIFMIFLNQAKNLLIILGISSLILISVGYTMGQEGFEKIIFGYLSSAVVLCITSTILTIRAMAKPSTKIFAKY